MERLGRVLTYGRWYCEGLRGKHYKRWRLTEPKISYEIYVTRGEFFPSEGEINVVSWNIERAYKEDEIREVLEQLDFNVLMLQESPISEKGVFSASLARELRWSSVYSTAILNRGFWERDFSGFGQATLSKFPIQMHEVVFLPNVFDWEEMSGGKAICCRYALYTKIVMGKQKQVVGIYNLHEENFAAPRHRLDQMLPVLEHVNKMGDDLIIIGGDFNTWCKGMREPAIRLLEREGFDYVPKDRKLLRVVNILDTDHFLTRGFPISQARVLRTIFASDHKPLQMRLSLKNIPTSGSQ